MSTDCIWSGPPIQPSTHHPRPHQDITACESEATKKGVQVGAAQKQLEKLGKEAAKNQAEKEKMEAQRDETMQVRWRGPCWWKPRLGLGAAEAGRQQPKLVIACSSSLPKCHATPAATPATPLPPSAPTPLHPPARTSRRWRTPPSRCARRWSRSRRSWRARRRSWAPRAPSTTRRRRRWAGAGLVSYVEGVVDVQGWQGDNASRMVGIGKRAPPESTR